MTYHLSGESYWLDESADEKASWREHITGALAAHDESWDDVLHCTLSKEQLDVRFYDGYGGSKGKPFTLWTKKRVYFPVVYDGKEWVESVPRDPCDEATGHVGGE